MRRLLPLALPLLLAAACASDGYDSVDEYRTEAVRPERQIPSEIVEMREDMAGMRSDTLARLDEVMGGAAADSGFWYSPIFDAIDFAVSITRIFF